MAKKKGETTDAAAGAGPDANGAAEEETDQAQGGGNPHVPIARSIPAAAEADARDHETVECKVLLPINEEGRTYREGEFLTTTRRRAGGIGSAVLEIPD